VIDEFVQRLPYAEQRSVFRDNATRYIEAFAEYYHEAKSLLQTKSQSDMIPKNCQITVPIQPSERIKESQAYKTLAANVAGFTRSVGIRIRDFVHQCKTLNNEGQKQLYGEIFIKALPNLAEILLAAEHTTHPINRHDLVAAILSHHINEICASLSIPTDTFISTYTRIHNITKYTITSKYPEAPNKDMTPITNNKSTIPTDPAPAPETPTPLPQGPDNPYMGKSSSTPSSLSTTHTTEPATINRTTTTNSTDPPTNTTITPNPITNITATPNIPITTPLNHTTTETPILLNHPNQQILNGPSTSTNHVLFDISFSQITNWGDFETSDEEHPSTTKHKDPPSIEQPDPKRANTSHSPVTTPGQNKNAPDKPLTTPTPTTVQPVVHSSPTEKLCPSFWHAISTCFLRSQAAYITQYNHNATALNLRCVLTKQRLEESADDTLSLLTSEDTPTPKTISAIVDAKVRETEKHLKQQLQSLRATYNDERNKRMALERTIKQHHLSRLTTQSKDAGAKPTAGAEAKKSARVR
jgi:hypothetical protein